MRGECKVGNDSVAGAKTEWYGQSGQCNRSIMDVVMEEGFSLYPFLCVCVCVCVCVFH